MKQCEYSRKVSEILDKYHETTNSNSLSWGHCEKKDEHVYQYGLCANCLKERFKPLRKIIDEVRPVERETEGAAA